MNLNKYDNKKVRLKTIYGDTFEGISYFYSHDYNEHEYGVDEESIHMSHIMIYKSQIKKIEQIQDFSSDYGELEEAVIEDGVDIIDEVFESDDDISIYRLLMCIDDKIESFKNNKELVKLLDRLIKYNEDKEVLEKAKSIRVKMVI